MKKLIITMCVGLSMQGCAFYYSKPVTNGFNNGAIKTDMTASEVKEKIGKPSNIGIRKISDSDTRQVWRYNEYSPGARGIALGILTFGIGFFIPPDSEAQYLIFQNDKLVGVNLPDPYAPDLIIEKRDR